jgi:hypothetical protein
MFIALTDAIQSQTDKSTDNLSAGRPKMCVPAMKPTSTCPRISSIGAARRNTALSTTLQYGDESRSDEQRTRNIPPWVADLPDDIRRGVPARVGIHHKTRLIANRTGGKNN